MSHPQALAHLSVRNAGVFRPCSCNKTDNAIDAPGLKLPTAMNLYEQQDKSYIFLRKECLGLPTY